MKIANIIIHCSESAFGCANLIRKWHTEKGWKDIGYHYVILNGCAQASANQGTSSPYIRALDGSIEVGRYLDADGFITDNEVGSHALGYNDKSVGICLIGQRMGVHTLYPEAEGFTGRQVHSLLYLTEELCRRYHLPSDAVLGHCETASGKAQGKTCPNFNMPWFRESMLRPALTEETSV
jgi:hypothetical protein